MTSCLMLLFLATKLRCASKKLQSQQKAFVMTQHICYVRKAVSAMLCQKNLISPHKYLMMTQQKYVVLAKNLTSHRNELIQQKYDVSAKTC